MTIATEFEDYRRSVPVVNACTFANLSFQPPMNAIVKDAIDDYLNHAFGDIHPKPGFLQSSEDCKKELAEHLGCDVSCVAWTRDTTEGLNLFARSLKWSPGDNVLMLRSEHPNHGYCWQSMASEGLEVRLIDIADDEPATGAIFKKFADKKTRCIAISGVMFHNGIKNDIKSICEFAQSKGIEVVVDGTQEVGLNKVDVVELGVSAYCFGTHKGLNVPIGLGAMYVSKSALKKLKQTPPIVGAGCIENLRSDLLIDQDITYHADAKRFDHLNKPLLQIAALQRYLKFLKDLGMEKVENRLRTLSTILRHKLSEIGISCIGEGNTNFRYTHSNVVPFKDSLWLQYLNDNNIIASQYRNGIRLSFGLYNNEDDVNRIVEVFKLGLQKLSAR